jgi:hypothetical protein
MIAVLLLQETSWWQGVNIVWALLGIAILVGMALIILLSKRREDVQLIETKRADANEKMVKTREAEIADLTKRCEKAEEELEDTTAELRAVIGIKVKDLIEWWAIMEAREAHFRSVERDNRILRQAQGLGPNDDITKQLKE